MARESDENALALLMAAAAAAALDACSLKPLDDRAVELHEARPATRSPPPV